MTRLYISGPVTGMPGRNVDKFERAAGVLASAGYKVTVPTRIVHPSMEHGDAMKVCVVALAGCDGVCTLDGWQDSAGALLEVQCANAFGMPVGGLEYWVLDLGGEDE